MIFISRYFAYINFEINFYHIKPRNPYLKTINKPFGNCWNCSYSKSVHQTVRYITCIAMHIIHGLPRQWSGNVIQMWGLDSIGKSYRVWRWQLSVLLYIFLSLRPLLKISFHPVAWIPKIINLKDSFRAFIHLKINILFKRLIEEISIMFFILKWETSQL